MTLDAIARLTSMQAADGSFPSEVRGPNGTREDRNGFTTALVLRALRTLPGDPELTRLRSRALGFIERCRTWTVPGGFGFWPEGAHPPWGERLTADIDDTAIMTVELLRHGRLSQQDGMRTVCKVLLRNRVVARPEDVDPPWIADGAFLTWIAQAGQPNVVDCCVNANAAALMARMGASHLPGYQEAVRTILDGLDWAGDDPTRLRSLTPFYPATNSLFEAVEHAIECGALALTPALERVPSLTYRPDDADPGCCSSAYGATVWRCPALDLARNLRHSKHGLDNCDRSRRAIGRGVHHVVLRIP
jgi:hypothetical protein